MTPLTHSVVVPGLRLVSPLNEREHWRAKAKRASEQRGLVRLRLGPHRRGPAPFGYAVTITRFCKRRITDTDNLAASAKHVRDEVAAWLGVDDRDTGGTFVSWRVRQETVSKYAVGIEVVWLTEPSSLPSLIVEVR